MIEPAQVRAARALLNWTMVDLVAKSGISLATVKNIERSAVTPKAHTIGRLRTVFEEAGVMFLNDPGDVYGGKGVMLFDGAGRLGFRK